jgi:hypothetical protein
MDGKSIGEKEVDRRRCKGIEGERVKNPPLIAIA